MSGSWAGLRTGMAAHPGDTSDPQGQVCRIMTRKVFLVQEIIPSYRVPVFQRLARLDGVDLTVFYGRPSRMMQRDNLQNAATIDGFRHARIRLWEVGSRSWQPGILWKVLIGHPDVVIAGGGERVDRLLLLLICRLFGIRILWFEGGVPYIDETKIREYVRNGFLNRWFGGHNPRSWLAQKANGLIVYSEHARQYYLAAGFPARAIWVAPNAPDTEALAGYRAAWLRRSKELEAERKRFAPSGQRILFLLGRLNSARRVDLLLDAMRCLKDRGLAPSLVIVGDGSERQRLSDMAAHLGLDHVFFEGAIYDDLTLSKYFMVSDIFVSPGISSLAVKMAMAFGRPVVTAEFGLEVHDVQDGVNGFIFPVGRTDMLAERLQRLLESDDLRTRMGQNGLAVIQDRINIGRMVDGFRQAIFAEPPQGATDLDVGSPGPHRP